MGIDFGNKNNATASTENATVQNEIQPVKDYDIVLDRKNMTEALVNSDEVDDIVSTIEVHNLDTIVSFGADVAEEISKSSDVILNSMDMSKINETSGMLKTLAKVMDKFDIDEIKEEPNLINKIFGNVKNQMDKLLTKYHTLGEEIDKIYVDLKGYETEIKQSNKSLASLFDTNVNFYHELVKYILAGEQACNEIEAYIAQRQKDMENSGDQSIQFELTTLNQALMMMEQRTQDLRIAENVAIQSIPMIKAMEFSNYNLVRKINSAFIITLPVFKQALAQAMLLKRQKIQADSMAELDRKTNEMLIKNAKNTVEVTKATTRLTSGNSIQIETLETTWSTIVSGIEETKLIQEESRKKRIEDKARLENIKEEFKKEYHVPSKSN